LHRQLAYQIVAQGKAQGKARLEAVFEPQSVRANGVDTKEGPLVENLRALLKVGFRFSHPAASGRASLCAIDVNYNGSEATGKPP
jgi:hypothetical protein